MTTARGNPGVVAAAGRIFAVGGAGGTPAAPVAVPSTEVFDPHTGSWQQLAAMLPVARGSISAESTSDGTVLAVGGFIPPEPMASDRIDGLRIVQ